MRRSLEARKQQLGPLLDCDLTHGAHDGHGDRRLCADESATQDGHSRPVPSAAQRSHRGLSHCCRLSGVRRHSPEHLDGSGTHSAQCHRRPFGGLRISVGLLQRSNQPGYGRLADAHKRLPSHVSGPRVPAGQDVDER